MRATSLHPVLRLSRKTVLKVPSPICSPRVYEARGRVEKTLPILSDTGESRRRGEEGRGIRGRAGRPAGA